MFENRSTQCILIFDNQLHIHNSVAIGIILFQEKFTQYHRLQIPHLYFCLPQLLS